MYLAPWLISRRWFIQPLFSLCDDSYVTMQQWPEGLIFLQFINWHFQLVHYTLGNVHSLFLNDLSSTNNLHHGVTVATNLFLCSLHHIHRNWNSVYSRAAAVYCSGAAEVQLSPHNQRKKKKKKGNHGVSHSAFKKTRMTTKYRQTVCCCYWQINLQGHGCC